MSPWNPAETNTTFSDLQMQAHGQTIKLTITHAVIVSSQSCTALLQLYHFAAVPRQYGIA